MSTLETIAAKLADDTIEAMRITGDDRLYVEIGDLIGASSQTLEETYLTAIRVRLAERSARRLLNGRVAAARETATGKAQG